MKNETLVCPSPEFTAAIHSIGVTNPSKEARTPLTALEIAVFKELIRERPPVYCTLKQLFGPYWELIVAPRKFGLRVRRAVLQGAVPGLSCSEVQSGSTKQYLLNPAALLGRVHLTNAANDGFRSAVA